MLIDRYDALLLDLDGVVYRGDRALPGVADVLEQVRATGTPVLFLTNNSSKTPEQVAEKLRSMGISSSPDDVLTSAVATATMLESEGRIGSTAFVIGERGIREALEDVGVKVLDGEPERTDLVVVGWDRFADYPKIRTAGLLVQRGARLIATNADGSYPAPDGLWPGAGALLAAVTTTTGVTATVVGKPHRPLFEAAARKTGSSNPLVVGDRLDTDIAGAANVGWDSMLVWTGASRPSALPRAAHLPTYLGRDLSTVLRTPPAGRFTQAEPGDTEDVKALLSSAGLSAEGVEERIDRTLVCRNGKVMAATACLDPVDTFGILRSVAVRREVRGEGLGMLASAAAIHAGRQHGISSFILFSETAVSFFEQLGFHRVERSELPQPVRNSRHAAEECAASASALVLTLEAAGH